MSAPVPSPKAPGSPALSRALLAAAAAVVLVRWAYLALTGVTFEDALISLRYAENLASGLGLVYNPGERVFGASTPLYVLFLAGLTSLGLPALPIAKTLAAAADGVTLFLWGSWLLRRGSRWAPWFLAVWFGVSPVLVDISVTGMETSFALLLITLALLADLEDRPVACGAALGLLTLVRPEGALAAAVILGCRWRRTRVLPWQPALAAALIVLPWIVFAALYYGSPLPNSVPAKAAAYNLHRPSVVPNLCDTVARLAPIRGPFGNFAANLLLFPSLLLGAFEAWKLPRLRPLLLLFLTWWAYLVVPKTLLFPWYMPPLLLPAYVLASLGFEAWVHRDRRGASAAPWCLGLAALALVTWLFWLGERAALRQQAEFAVRREIGLWLRRNTPPDARIALEPIGYIGYYSGRRVLDEVGLVSPEMISVNRSGAGWFPEMIRRFQPDYIVERPYYLVRNLTLNSGVPMFRTVDEQDAFLAGYEPVARFATGRLVTRIGNDYQFVVFARRGPESARRWRALMAAAAPERREQLRLRALTGPVELNAHTAARPVPLRRP